MHPSPPRPFCSPYLPAAHSSISVSRQQLICFCLHRVTCIFQGFTYVKSYTVHCFLQAFFILALRAISVVASVAPSHSCETVFHHLAYPQVSEFFPIWELLQILQRASFPGSSDGNESACDAGHLGSIPGLEGRTPAPPGGAHPPRWRDGGAWWAAVCGVVQSRTRLKRLSSSSSSHLYMTTGKTIALTIQNFVGK